MVDGAANNLGDILSSGFGSGGCVQNMREGCMTDFWENSPAAERVRVAAMWAEASGCGNCGEQSAIASEWLRKSGVRPVERGRDPNSDVETIPTWGPCAVICDPWKNMVYLAPRLADLWPGGRPKLVTGVYPPAEKAAQA